MARSAAVKSKGASQGQLRLEIARAAAEAGRTSAPAPTVATEPPPAPPTMRTEYAHEVPSVPFGGWLVKQKGHRNEMVDGLAKAAAADPRFPEGATPDEVREYIGKKGADPDIIEAIDDAEAAWLRS